MSQPNIRDVAEQFLRLVRTRTFEQWKAITELPEVEVQAIMTLLLTAGFEVKMIRVAWMKGDFLDEDRAKTGKTYDVNTLWPVAVISIDGYEYETATRWLERMMEYANRRNTCETGEVVAGLIKMIEESRPLEPIKLTEQDDVLKEYPASNGVTHTRDHDKLRSPIGVHAVCRGFVDLKPSSMSHSAILCRQCGLRLSIPNVIGTYEELRRYLTKGVTPAQPSSAASATARSLPRRVRW